ncbi:MAG: hypothetical protein ACC645_25250 [Pirellulales bacterium]
MDAVAAAEKGNVVDLFAELPARLWFPAGSEPRRKHEEIIGCPLVPVFLIDISTSSGAQAITSGTWEASLTMPHKRKMDRLPSFLQPALRLLS